MKKIILIVILMCLPICNGCIAFYVHEKYHIRVIDAEQNKPVENAVVSTRYSYMMILNGPKPREAISDQDGLAELKIANAFPCRLTVKADGYVSVRGRGYRQKWYVPENVPKNHSVPKGDQITILIYKEPEPKMEIIVPDGYRGPVALHLIPSNNWIQEERGKRKFTYQLLPNGYMPIQASPLLYDVLDYSKSSITASYENGNNLSCQRCEPDDICLRWVYSCWEKKLYVIGTEREREELEFKACPIFEYRKDGGYSRSFEIDIYNSYFQE